VETTSGNGRAVARSWSAKRNLIAVAKQTSPGPLFFALG